MQQYQPRKDLSDTSRCRASKYRWPFLGGNRRRKQVSGSLFAADALDEISVSIGRAKNFKQIPRLLAAMPAPLAASPAYRETITPNSSKMTHTSLRFR